MSAQFETLGNASVIVFEGATPVLATDPWLTGTCYFGSWALDHPLSRQQIQNFIDAEWIWISHGHPDHLHDASLSILPAGKKVLLPDHYDDDIACDLRDRSFDVTVLPYRAWYSLTPGTRVMCIDNFNQDAILVIEADGALIIDLNDSPLCGEFDFLRRLIRRYPREKTYLLALCSVDADMFNFVDQDGQSLVGPPEERKPGAVWTVARTAAQLGVGNFCCSSSQHIYVRADSVWANPHRIGWADMRRYWSRPEVNLIEPFVTVDPASSEYVRNHPAQISDESQITATTADDNWASRLSKAEWDRVAAFVRKFQLIKRYIDFVEFQVGGEVRRIPLGHRGVAANARGIVFHLPKQSLLTTVEYGYLDDLLIGNFMQVRLENCKLYPRFTPLVAKVGGNAKVYTPGQYYRFAWRYFRRNPVGMIGYWSQIEWEQIVLPGLRTLSERLGVKRPLKYLYRRWLGDPVGTGKPV
ncbi:MAG TPA: hypothetical protein VHX39_09730 [Acetobacteraceae bacterium]|nr:hypothetical protein [Acetobacteraceae bacterium]